MLADDIALSQTNPAENLPLRNVMRDYETQRRIFASTQEYDKAKQAVIDEAEAIRKDRIEREAKEVRRQQMEKTRFQKGREMTVQRHEEEWAGKLAVAEEQFQAKIEALKARHQRDLKALAAKIDHRNAHRRCIHSAYVRDMLLTEKKLAEGNQFDESKMVRRKIKDLEIYERDQFEIDKDKIKEENINRLIEKQDAEVKHLQTNLKNQRLLLIRKANEERKRLAKSFVNLENDMAHAHKMEFTTGRSTTVSLPPSEERRLKKKTDQREAAGMPHGSNPGRVATYRGSQMLISQRGKFPLLSLCDLYDPENPEEPHLNLNAPKMPPLC
eukprot:TRINITY_DN60552_c0_g1_i1.p1 TRINITY_DN60552_c0_g1~~TRINITY_DN60552_c0_g1_i1.p1  ORF type:complete len:328 (-),score=37.92 TRINITY_DN60552_c0_g1_i1:994-1977(-)